MREANSTGRWTSVWASLRERGKAKRPPHVGPGKVVLPPVSPKELGSDLPRPKKDARQPVILRCGFWCPGRDVCGSRRSPNRGEKRTVRGTPWARLPFDLLRPPPRFSQGRRRQTFLSCRNREPRGVTTADCPSCCPLGCSRRPSLTPNTARAPDEGVLFWLPLSRKPRVDAILRRATGPLPEARGEVSDRTWPARGGA